VVVDVKVEKRGEGRREKSEGENKKIKNKK